MRESTFWMLHLAAGAVMLVVLGIHYGVMHLGELFDISRATVLSFPSVQIRSHSPFFLVVYFCLLVAALYHGLYGLRSLICELSIIGERARKAISILIVLTGCGFFCYGAYAIIAGFVK
jgi:succinate dehydrogenase hydrophobic anchor subunit